MNEPTAQVQQRLCLVADFAFVSQASNESPEFLTLLPHRPHRRCSITCGCVWFTIQPWVTNLPSTLQCPVYCKQHRMAFNHHDLRGKCIWVVKTIVSLRLQGFSPSHFYSGPPETLLIHFALIVFISFPRLCVCVVVFPPTLADTGLDSAGAHARFHINLFLLEKKCFDPEKVSLGWLEAVAGI